MRKLMLSLGLCALVGIGGCTIHGHHDGCPDEVLIEARHVHTDHCGHYYRHGRGHHHYGHRHGAGCGQVWRGGMWIVID